MSNVIVVGCGRVGSQLANMLSDNGNNVCCIDKNADAFANLGRNFNGSTVQGVGFDEDVLIRAGVEECDVLAAVTQALNAMGAQVEEYPDSLTIHGRDHLDGGATVDSCNDHRIAMMAAIAATRGLAPVTIIGAQCVAKSYPNFWEDYEALGGQLIRSGAEKGESV